MSIVLIVAEQQPDGQLRKATLNALHAGAQLAQKVAGELHVVALGKDVAALAQELSGYGVKAVHAASVPAFEHYLAALPKKLGAWQSARDIDLLSRTQADPLVRLGGLDFEG